MNRIAEYSPEWYEEVRKLAGEEAAGELTEIEAQIREETKREYAQRLEGAAWWRKALLKRELESTVEQRTREAFETVLAQRGVPKASAESLW